MAFFKELAKVELEAIRDANKTYPLETSSQIEANLSKNTAEVNRLTEKYSNEVYAEYSVTKDEVSKIIKEGIARQWPLD